jgi:MFS family permease
MVAVPLVVVSMAGAVLLGVLAVGWLASQQTLLQTNVADRYLGRAFGAFNTTNALTLLLGTLLAGALADFAGVPSLLYMSAVLYSAAGALALLLLTHHREKHEG